jgi:hypothetical protein
MGLPRPVPAEVRYLIERVSPGVWANSVSSIRLLAVDEMGWLSADGGAGDELFSFAAGIYGDAILWSGRDQEIGAVLLADHESEGGLVVLETSLAAWLRRLAEFGGIEFAYVTAEIEHAAPDVARQFLGRHLALNPALEWAAREMAKLGQPARQGHPDWNAERHTLLPAAEPGQAESVTLSAATQRQLESIADAGKARSLTVSGGQGLDFSCLARQSAMRSLRLYDLGEVDASQLAFVSGLEDVEFRRCKVRRLDRLAGISTLKRVRLPESDIDEAELDTLRGLRSNPRLGIAR